jgi:WD40 repeat protein
MFSPDGGRILVSSGGNLESGYVQLWDATSGQIPGTSSRHRDQIRFAAFSHDSTRILIAADDDTAQLWDVASGQPIAKPFQHRSMLVSEVFSPDGTRILTAAGGHTAWLSDAASGQFLADLRHEGCVRSATFSPDGTKILTASDDRTARLWDTTSGKPLGAPFRHDQRVLSAIFSPDGTRILTAADDNTARLWDAATGRPLVVLRHDGSVRSVAFSLDGSQILTASGDDLAPGSANLWDAATGELLIEPFRHDSCVRSAVISPDGTRILTASGQHGKPGCAQIWGAVSGQLLAEPLHHDGPVFSAIFSPACNQILTASGDSSGPRYARLWHAASGKLLAEDHRRLRALIEIIGSRRLDTLGVMKRIPSDYIENYRCELDSETEMDRLLSWWWSDPYIRPVHPSVSMTVPEFLRLRIREVLDNQDDRVKASARQDALAAIPHHPLVLLCLPDMPAIAASDSKSEQKVDQKQRPRISDRILNMVIPKSPSRFLSKPVSPDHPYGNPAWLAQYAVSRLLAEPHYLTPLQSRMTDTHRAARAYELKEGLAEDCFLAARLLERQNRPDLARQCISRSRSLCPENEEYRNLQP